MMENIQMSNGFIGEIFSDEPLPNDFWENVEYAQSLMKPTYLIINGTAKYPAAFLRKIFSYDWRKIYITDTGRYRNKNQSFIVYHAGDGTMRDNPNDLKTRIDIDTKLFNNVVRKK